jgi:phosphoglycolate phosphatase-like HAD superfamily hydrolase
LSTISKISPIAVSEVVAIGDTPYDVAAARKARIRSIAVKSGGFPESSLVDAGAVEVYDSVGDLFDRLKDSLITNTGRAAP